MCLLGLRFDILVHFGYLIVSTFCCFSICTFLCHYMYLVSFYYMYLHFCSNCFTKSVCRPRRVDLDLFLGLFGLYFLCAVESFWRARGVEMLGQRNRMDVHYHFV